MECRRDRPSGVSLLQRCHISGNRRNLVVAQQRNDQTHQLPLASTRSALPCMELCFDILFMLARDAGKSGSIPAPVAR
jgi:hypothetical protein